MARALGRGTIKRRAAARLLRRRPARLRTWSDSYRPGEPSATSASSNGPACTDGSRRCAARRRRASSFPPAQRGRRPPAGGAVHPARPTPRRRRRRQSPSAIEGKVGAGARPRYRPEGPGAQERDACCRKQTHAISTPFSPTRSAAGASDIISSSAATARPARRRGSRPSRARSRSPRRTSTPACARSRPSPPALRPLPGGRRSRHRLHRGRAAALPRQRLPSARRHVVRTTGDPAEGAAVRDFGLPERRRAARQEHRGLILRDRATGSGRPHSRGIVDYINRSRASHIVTIEDPIEVLHEDHMSIINQREIGLDTQNFGQALRRALRQESRHDPDRRAAGRGTAQTALQARNRATSSSRRCTRSTRPRRSAG